MPTQLLVVRIVFRTIASSFAVICCRGSYIVRVMTTSGDVKDNSLRTNEQLIEVAIAICLPEQELGAFTPAQGIYV
ncbi:uncharacterized protein F5891DRAFT_1028898 [Suillus fuscotomentosus]|uniref:Uncharacterized protein n=1 Tax=Suillus fuscotomentosus TaxID=1912939 RepID=A0AAD4E7U2_9AGAM|nr:uncharacterized protein F5891DRAFT_1028898 [Suillus fuscotomentosus]KAG1901328.1 hypothetical protein F5891DRAFT_1028898 [Suillus fuscotomentosus]